MNSFKNITTAFALIIILFLGCKNPADDVKIVVNTDIFKSPTLIQFVNAKKGAAGPQDFTVTITGPNADLVRTSTGGKSFKATSGLLNLLLDRSANPTPASPVKFTVVATAEGFAPVFQDVVITSATEPTLYKVTLAEYANPGIGTGAIVDTKTISNGTTSNDIVITTSTNTGITQKTEVTLTSGTGLLDAAGQSVGGAQLETRIVFNGTATDGTTPIAPGGNIGANVIGANGQPIVGGVNFYSAGSVTIDMFAGTKEVKSFTKPIIVDMEVSATMINPSTNQPIKVGETIPLWSLNDETGQWKAEGNATFALNAAGKLVAKMPITHLSSWMPAYPNTASTTCTTTVIINKPRYSGKEVFTISGLGSTGTITFNAGETSKSITVTVAKNTSGAITVSRGVGNYEVSSYAHTPVYVNNILTSAVVTDFCSKTTTFDFVAPPSGTILTVDVFIMVECKNLRTGFNGLVTVTPVNAPEETMIYNLSHGGAVGQIISGRTYNIVASVDGKSYTGQFTGSKTNSQLPTGFDIVGQAVYNGREGILFISGRVALPNCK